MRLRPLWHRPGPPADAVAPLEPARAPPSILVCSACGGGALLSASIATGLKVLPKSSMRSTSSPWCEVHESSGDRTPGLRLNFTNLPPCSFIIGSLPTVTVDGAGGVTSAGVSSWLE